MSNEVILEVEDAKRAIHGARLLAGIDLKVARGEIVVVLGPNGAGKSSLLRAIVGRLRLDAGHVRVGGVDPLREAGARLRIGWVPQETALLPELTVAENLRLWGAVAGVANPNLEAAVTRALEWIDLASRRDVRVRTLSGGQKRRVHVAASTLHEPDLLLLDEPTVGLDAPARAGVQEMLRGFRSRGAGVLLATHDFSEAADVADRLVILMDGRVRAEGSSSSILEHAKVERDELRLREPELRRAYASLTGPAEAGTPQTSRTAGPSRP